VYTGRALVATFACTMLVAACADEKTPAAAECIKVVDAAGEPTDACLPVAPGADRVDLGTPVFSKPTEITNPLHPTSLVDQVIMGGRVEGKPFRTEVTRLPGTKPIPVRGAPVDAAIVQYVAYLDGRIHEVALDWYAQADDGSVWYLGEDVFNYEDGKVADTNGTWVAGDATPAALIMPANPAAGDVYRPENAPEVAFEEVRVDKVDLEIAGPSGIISGAIEVTELHMDGTREGKVFAPGYGEFSTGTAGGDLEAASLAVPTDSKEGPAPAEFGALSAAVNAMFDAVASEEVVPANQSAAVLNQAWTAVVGKGIPSRLQAQMNADVAALDAVISQQDWEAAQSAALRIAQNDTDLRMLHHRVIDVDLDRLQLWTRQLRVDVATDDARLVLAAVAALERVWERTRHGVDPTAPVDAALKDLRKAADAEDPIAVDRFAAALNQAVSALQAR
jgi:hypothetical protein